MMEDLFELKPELLKLSDEEVIKYIEENPYLIKIINKKFKILHQNTPYIIDYVSKIKSIIKNNPLSTGIDLKKAEIKLTDEVFLFCKENNYLIEAGYIDFNKPYNFNKEKNEKEILIIELEDLNERKEKEYRIINSIMTRIKEIENLLKPESDRGDKNETIR